MTIATAIIGREAELVAVERFLDPLGEGARALVVEGEAGIGKTTIWMQAVGRAREEGFQVLAARPAEAEAPLAFAALTDLLADVYDEARDGLPAPQQRALDAALLRAEVDEPPDRRTTATAFLGVLTSLAEKGPVVVAIDDAQWLDPSSAAVLEFAARRLPAGIGLLVARRLDGEVAAPVGLERAFAGEQLERLAVGPLSLASLYRLFDSRLGLRLPRPLLVRIQNSSGGNPFFALEIARALDGSSVLPSDPLPVPSTLRELVSARLRRLSPGALEAARIAAALSRPTAAQLREASSAAKSALDELERAGILVEDAGRLHFTHPLLASVAYAEWRAEERRDRHRRLAATVDDRDERARQLARGVTEPDEEVAAELEGAAERALRRGAPEAAAELYDAASRLTPKTGRAEAARRLLGGAAALFVVTDLDGSRSLAAEALETAPNGAYRARALMQLASIAQYAGTAAEYVEHLERALTEPIDDETRAVILVMLAEGEVRGNPQRALQRSYEALVLLGGREHPRLAQALIQTFFAGVVLGHGAQRELLDEALAAEAHSSGFRSPYPLIWFYFIDDREATHVQHRLHDEEQRERGDDSERAWIVEFVAMVEFRAGNWDDAERDLEQACATLEQFPAGGPMITPFASRATIDAHRGRIERARATLYTLLAEIDPSDVFWRMICHTTLGLVEFFAGDNEAAEHAWTLRAEEADLVGWKECLEDRSEPDRVEALLALGEPERARSVLKHLEWRGRTLPRLWIDATLPRARALILAADGDIAGALVELERAPEVQQLPFERARLLLVQGRLRRRAKQKRAAAESLREALALFERLGAPLFAEQARAELARVGLRRAAPGELSDTERRIAELAAQGLTNKEIAQAAFVSPKTVEANLARVYTKLGIRSRAELGGRMADARTGDTSRRA